MALIVEEVPASVTLDLRGRVLREGRPHEGFPEDDQPGTFHLVARLDGRVVGVASFMPRGERAWQLRGMAVEPDVQGQGAGRAVLAAGIERLRSAGAQRLWANGRDTALGFYQRMGFQVGEAVVLHGMAHHVIELAL
jgi:N-acetylglutamate synthase-like GNAT family acetyltransferase